MIKSNRTNPIQYGRHPLLYDVKQTEFDKLVQYIYVFCFASATDVVNTCKGYLARALIISALADEGLMMWLKKMTSTLGHGPLELKNI